MAKTVAEKLLIKPNSTLWTSHVDRLQPVEPLPEGVELIERPGEAPTALVWASDEASLRELLSAHGSGLVQAATLWVAYPKGNRADINRDTLWPILAEYGLRPSGQVVTSRKEAPSSSVQLAVGSNSCSCVVSLDSVGGATAPIAR